MVPVRLDAKQLATLDAFQRIEGLASREAALGVLVGIAFKTIASPEPRLQPPVWSARDVYRSSNGDVWSLLHEAGSGRLRVRHRANAASGGHCREMDVDAFLLTGNGPEHTALRALVSGLGEPA